MAAESVRQAILPGGSLLARAGTNLGKRKLDGDLYAGAGNASVYAPVDAIITGIGGNGDLHPDDCHSLGVIRATPDEDEDV